jgi:hypothetical protein
LGAIITQFSSLSSDERRLIKFDLFLLKLVRVFRVGVLSLQDKESLKIYIATAGARRRIK